MCLILVVSKFIHLSLFSVILPSINCEQLDFEKLCQNDFEDLSYMGDKQINAVPKAMEIREIVKELIDSEKENKVIVKRIVPHNKPFKMEYDDKFKLLYKPLIRLDKSNQNTDSIESKYLTKISPSFQTNKILQKIFKMSPISLKDDKMNYFRELAEKINKRNKMVKIHNKLVDLIGSVLRSPQFEKSGEDNDMLAPGEKVVTDEYETKSEKPKKWIPHYPPWNFWTVN
ncbi:unnamed protein product, partial [Brenthis ino]